MRKSALGGLVLLMVAILIGFSPAAFAQRWVNKSHPAHYFEKHDGEWVEFSDGKIVYRYAHKRTTSEFVEMYDASRNVTVRIYADHDAWSTDLTSWTTSVYGSWQAGSSSR